MKVSGPKFEVIADHSSDMSTGVSKRSAQKSSARKSKKLRELHAFWDNDFKRDSKSKALGNLKKLYGHEKIFQGDSLISMWSEVFWNKCWILGSWSIKFRCLITILVHRKIKFFYKEFIINKSFVNFAVGNDLAKKNWTYEVRNLRLFSMIQNSFPRI